MNKLFGSITYKKWQIKTIEAICNNTSVTRQIRFTLGSSSFPGGPPPSGTIVSEQLPRSHCNLTRNGIVAMNTRGTHSQNSEFFGTNYETSFSLCSFGILNRAF